ncbi:MAG TPA: chemotaxis protein CheW [Coleofasciculaceae cyanobacterium]|jgi:purine-binding chemotaxis protein CheW
MKTFATFKVNGQLYGVEILYVREINRHLDITRVQHAPECIRGLANLRGQIVTVIDLCCRLSQHPMENEEGSYFLILRTDAELAAIRQAQDRTDLASLPDCVCFLIDAVDEIVSLDDSEIEPPPSNIGEAEAEYMEGVAKLENRLLSILSVSRLLAYGGKPAPINLGLQPTRKEHAR